MKYYKYQIKVLNEGTPAQVTLGLNTSKNVNNFVAKDRLNEFSYFSINDENSAEFISQNDENLGINEISESEFNEAIKNTFTYERINELLELDKAQKAAEIKEKFEKAMDKTPVNVAGVGIVDGGRYNLQDVAGIIETFEESGGSTMLFRIADNSFVQVNGEQLKAIKKAIILKGQELYQKKWQIETSFISARTFDEIMAIKVEL